MTWPPPQPDKGKIPRVKGVQLIGGPDHGKIGSLSGTHIEPTRVIGVDGKIRPAGDGVYEYRYFTVPYGVMYVAIWIPQQIPLEARKNKWQ